VQRVVWNLLRESIASTPLCQATVHQAGRFLPYEGFEPPRSQKLRSNVLNSMPMGYQLFAKALCKLLPWTPLRKSFLPEPGRLGLLRNLIKRVEKSELKSRQRVTGWKLPGEGDLLLLPDAYWGLPGIWKGVSEARRNGATVATVLYDLIPITHPQFVPPSASASFGEYIREVVKNSDILIAISKTVRDQCREAIDRDWPGVIPAERIQAFRLGADIVTVRGEVSQTIGELYSPKEKQTPYLMVATFDPRKNHTCVLEAFELLWRKQPSVCLCFVGGRGWMSDELLQKIESHPRYCRQLFKFHAMSDADLRHCYENARGVICPSFVEGFGLPIVEGLAYGRKTFVADTQIHREVGRDECDYFAPHKPNELAEQLMSWEAQLSFGSPLQHQTRQPTTWLEASQELLNQCFAQNVSRPSLSDKTWELQPKTLQRLRSSR
jgi:hypothetical protein